MAKNLHEVAREFLRQLRREKEKRGERFEPPNVQVVGSTSRPKTKTK